MGKYDLITKELDQTEKEIIATRYSTDLKKMQFINEIKNGLGKEIKTIGNKVKIIKLTRYQRCMLFLKKIFTKL